MEEDEHNKNTSEKILLKSRQIKKDSTKRKKDKISQITSGHKAPTLARPSPATSVASSATSSISSSREDLRVHALESNQLQSDPEPPSKRGIVYETAMALNRQLSGLTEPTDESMEVESRQGSSKEPKQPVPLKQREKKTIMLDQVNSLMNNPRDRANPKRKEHPSPPHADEEGYKIPRVAHKPRAPPAPTITSTRNRYEAISDDSGSEAGDEGVTEAVSQKRPRPPPPIIIPGKIESSDKYNTLLQIIKDNTTNTFHIRHTTNIFLHTEKDRQTLMKALDLMNTHYYTFTNKTDKTHAFVRRHQI